MGSVKINNARQGDYYIGVYAFRNTTFTISANSEATLLVDGRGQVCLFLLTVHEYIVTLWTLGCSATQLSKGRAISTISEWMTRNTTRRLTLC